MSGPDLLNIPDFWRGEPNSGVALPDHDAFKVHNEINQMMQQRFSLTNQAMGLFAGTVAALLAIAKNVNEKDRPTLIVFASCTYLVLLLALSLQMVRLRAHMRIFNAYLLARYASVWERDWLYFRHAQEPIAMWRKLFLIFWPFRQEHAYWDVRANNTIIAILALLAGLLPTIIMQVFVYHGLAFEWLWLVPFALGLYVIAYLEVASRLADRKQEQAICEWTKLLDGRSPQPLCRFATQHNGCSVAHDKKRTSCWMQ